MMMRALKQSPVGQLIRSKVTPMSSSMAACRDLHRAADRTPLQQCLVKQVHMGKIRTETLQTGLRMALVKSRLGTTAAATLKARARTMQRLQHPAIAEQRPIYLAGTLARITAAA